MAVPGLRDTPYMHSSSPMTCAHLVLTLYGTPCTLHGTPGYTTVLADVRAEQRCG